jgi:hypothetical protein
MGEPEQIMTRYLLGELSESERTELEESYFSDPRLFDQLQKVENDLLDDYARGRLSSSLGERIEQRYLAHPELRGRLRFAEALVTRLDTIEQPVSAAPAPSQWAAFVSRFRARAPALAISGALAALFLFVAGSWFFVRTTTRLRQELRDTQAARAAYEQRERDLQQQLADEQARSAELASEVDRSRRELETPGPRPRSSTPLIASLILEVGGVRGPETGPPTILFIPAGASQARLRLKLSDNDYPTYTLVLESSEGKQVFKRDALLPSANSHRSLVFTVPTNKLADGDYILALKGVTQAGEIEDVSKSLFRVERK